jgi:hypothetical protein
VAKNQNGRLMAMPGTKQGLEGYYQGEDKVYYCKISPEGEWEVQFPGTDLRDFRRTTLTKTPQLDIPGDTPGAKS